MRARTHTHTLSLFTLTHTDYQNVSCRTSFAMRNEGGSRHTASYTERDASWHHLAVTWDSAKDGLTNIYMDGLFSECRAGVQGWIERMKSPGLAVVM